MHSMLLLQHVNAQQYQLTIPRTWQYYFCAVITNKVLNSGRSHLAATFLAAKQGYSAAIAG